jgi:HPt (histidine-containing phosphotransfer) domain-containing protein
MKSIIDLSAAENALRLDRETILMLLGIFFSSQSDYIEPLQKAADEEELINFKREAHRLKGAANNLRLESIGSLALELEQMVEPFHRKEAEETLQKIKAAFELGSEELACIQAEDPS